MTEASRTWRQLTFEDLGSAISSPGSPDGASRCDSPVCPTTPASGPDRVRASRSATLASGSDSPTSATSGPSGSGSSVSAALQLSLESRLRVGLAGRGSILYSLTWKERVTPARRRICQLRASALRTADSGFSSWPTPTVSRGDYSRRTSDVRARTGWPTPLASDGTVCRETLGHGVNNPSLLGAARRATWPTPKSQDAERGGSIAHMDGRRSNLCDTAMTAGLPAIGSSVEIHTEARPSPGQLSPEHSRWIMGYPAVWGSCADTATRSSRKK